MFGDRSPAAEGHYLVITKEHIRELTDPSGIPFIDVIPHSQYLFP